VTVGFPPRHASEVKPGEVIHCVDQFPAGDQGKYQLLAFVLVNMVTAVPDLQNATA
jgi:hypothetical protein